MVFWLSSWLENKVQEGRSDVTRIRYDRAGDRVFIHMPGRTVESTPSTLSLLGIENDKDIVGITQNTMERLLSYARSGCVIKSLSILAHARYHGFYVAGYDYSDGIRLNVGGLGYEFSRQFLSDNFMYFKSMLNNFREAEQNEIFIDRDYTRFEAVIYVVQYFLKKDFVTESTQEELRYYGYVFPESADPLRDHHRGYI